jgi:hypothetical protein
MFDEWDFSKIDGCDSSEEDVDLIQDADTILKVDIILIDEFTVMETERWMHACEQCAENAAIPFDYLLDATTWRDPSQTDYAMYRTANCPCCGRAVTEKTLVVA